MTYKEHVERRVAKALDWLEANPRLHITGTMATTGPDGMAIDANSPAATCFCAMGRILHEMKRPNTFADEILKPLGVPHEAVMALNDMTDGSHIARVEALRGLFTYAAGIPDLAKMTFAEQAIALDEYMDAAMRTISCAERDERKGFVYQKPLAS